jgi:MFS transporter, DHA2 family, multidrug resistance protein
MATWGSTLLRCKCYYSLSFFMFTAASVLCGLARSLEMMIAGRVLQDVGGGGLIPVAQAIMLETFPEEERGMAMIIYSMGVVAAGVGAVG